MCEVLLYLSELNNATLLNQILFQQAIQINLLVKIWGSDWIYFFLQVLYT